jgi:hypothetical protein
MMAAARKKAMYIVRLEAMKRIPGRVGLNDGTTPE